MTPNRMRDLDLFFGPIEFGDRTAPLPENWTMLDILVNTGVFPSKNIARKNGFKPEIPKGFTLFRIGKGKATEIAILC